MPTQHLKKTEKQSLTRAKILQCAASLIAEQGYAATSIAKISKRSGVLSGSIYWAFPSKEAIFAEVLRQAGEQWRNAFIQLHGEDWPPQDLGQFEIGIRQLSSAFAEAPEFLRLIMVVATERQGGADEVIDVAKKIRRDWRLDLESFLINALANYQPDDIKIMSQRISRLAIQLFDGTFLYLQLEQDEIPLQQLFDELAATLISEIKRELQGISITT